MNTGIQDMINLCWKLALVLRGKAVPALLDTYQQERLPLIESLVRTTEKATDAFNSESPWAHWLLTRVVPLALDLDAVQHRGTRILSELSADYRRSPLSSAAPGHAGLRPGDRAPDLSVRTLTAPAPGTAGVHAPVHPPASGRPAAVGASGTEAGGSTERPSRLYELLDPDRPTLVAVAPEHGGPATAEGAAGRLEPWRGLLSFRRIAVGPRQLPGLDVDATARELRSRGGLLLVRPDAYLAAVAPLDDPAALRSWLGRWLTPAHAVAERPATV